ncbi:hypothetical protein CHCC20335_4274 [Bacillus paralicheniformis]|nr:hypothetical protein CHCC20335_4274 [Bacillus paralicheniformis]
MRFSFLFVLYDLVLIHSATGASYDPASVSLNPQIVKSE